MKDSQEWTTPRLVEAAFGLLFVILAIVILAITDRSAGPLLAALVVGLLGAEALFAAFRGTRSWLSRIGPLP